MRPIDSDALLAIIKRNVPYLYHMIAPIVALTHTLDVAPVVHGRWEYPAGNKCVSSATCSACRRRINRLDAYKFYCPACGAKMDGDSE